MMRSGVSNRGKPIERVALRVHLRPLAGRPPWPVFDEDLTKAIHAKFEGRRLGEEAAHRHGSIELSGVRVIAAIDCVPP